MSIASLIYFIDILGNIGATLGFIIVGLFLLLIIVGIRLVVADEVRAKKCKNLFMYLINDGALLITRLTTAQRNLLNPIQGMVIYNLTTGFYEVYSSGNAWEPLAEGEGGGVLPYYITAGPLQMATNSIYFLNAAGTITATLPAVANLGDLIEINTMNGNFIIAQNAGQEILMIGAHTTVGVGGSVTSITGAGTSIKIGFNSQLWVVQSFEGTFNFI
jgi:hypothetical protein